jgi:PEP-CTERM motif
MKTLLRSLVAGALVGCTMLYAQNFNGTDDFTSNYGYWASESASNGGLFTVSGGVLNFTDNGITTGQTSMAGRNWTLNAGSYTADWQVQVDVTLGVIGQVAGQVTTWALSLASSEDPYNSAQFTFQQNYMMPTMRFLNGNFYYSDGVETLEAPVVASTDTITMRASFLVASHTLALEYNGGSGFSPLLSWAVDGVGLGWGMGSSDTFNLTLSAYNTTSANPTSPLMSGVYADNFIAAPAAVPEPSAYAALAGLAVLGLAMARRHQSVRR